MKSNLLHKDPSSLLRCRDSIYAMDLLICAVGHFDFFTFLNDSPRTFDEICNSLKIHSRPADVLVTLLMSMALIKMHDHRYVLTELSETYLVSDSSVSLVPYYGVLKNRPQCLEFLEVLQTGKPAGWSSIKDGQDWIKSMQDQKFADSFTAAMDSRGIFLGQKLAEKLDLSAYSSLLDIAGGSGIYACSLSSRNRHMAATVLELPPVNLAAERSIERKGMASRVNVITGDMFEHIPTGYDVHLFANAFHDWEIESLMKIAANSFQSLSPGGLIAVFDAHLNESKNGPLPVAEYSCLLMHCTEGRCYSFSEIGGILISAGFDQIEVIEVAADRTVITGKKI
jgi:hypothetical protein